MFLEAAQSGAGPGEPSPEAMNARLWTRGADPFAGTIAEGELTYTGGGLGAEQETRVRVLAVPGPQATIRGVARTLAWITNLADGAPKWLDLDTVARGLLFYNRNFLDVRKGADGTWGMGEWKVGMLLTLPIEIELNADRTIKRFVVSGAKLSEWAATPNWQTGWSGLLTKEPAPLPLPDPDALAAEVKTRLDEPWDPDGFAAELRPEVLTNPYAVVFRAIETMRQLRRDHPGRRLPMLLAFAQSVGREQAAQVGWTSAGNAVLRAFWKVLAAADPGSLSQADRDRLARAKEIYAAALGLKAKEGGGWHGPLEVGPTVVPTEPPLTERQSTIRKKEDAPNALGSNPLGQHEMALGRDLTVGPIGVYEGWKGPAYAGDKDPAAFAAAHPDAVAPSPTELQKAALDVALKIAGNEGRLDACRAQDSALLSTGIQQWSVHVNTEMSVLLHRFREHAPEHYDLFFGMYGLQTAKWAPQTGRDGPDAASPTADRIDQVNPFAAPAGSPHRRTSQYGDNFASYVTFRQLPPGEPEKPLPLVQGSNEPRFTFFGGRRNAQKKLNEFSGEWAARIRTAALASTDYCAVQLQTAVFRFQRVLDQPRPEKPSEFKQDPDLRTLFTSEFAAALLLDEHINRPAVQIGTVSRALSRTLKQDASPYESASSNNFRPAWLMQLTIDYLVERRFKKAKGGGLRADGLMRTRNEHILTAHSKGLDPRPASFKGWATGL